MKRRCTSCRWAALKDHGYSNYTVEGTEVYCIMRLHPEAPFDKGWNTDETQPKLKFAETCAGYNHGEPAEFDVDGESYTVTAEQVAVMELSGSWADFLAAFDWKRVKAS